MLDVTQLGENELLELSFLYDTSTGKSASIRKARRTARIKADRFSHELIEYIKSCTDAELFAFLGECSAEARMRYREKRERATEKFASFDERVRFAALELWEGHTLQRMSYSDGVATITIDDGAFYIYLRLYGVTEFCEDFEYKYLYYVDFGYDETKDEYYSAVGSEDFDELRFTFTDAKAEYESYNPLAGCFVNESPWFNLSRVCCEILNKADSVPELLSDKEKEHLPLIREVGNLSFATEDRSFPTLRALALKHDLRSTEKLFAKFEKALRGRADRIRKKLFRKMNRISHVKMWREIYDMINEAESDYPTPTECTLDTAEVSAVRERVTEILYDRGYSGVYPCFTKPLKPRKFLCFLSHGMHYIAFGEKRMQARVYFAESTIGIPTLRVCSGTVFYRKNEFVDDFFSFAFDARGRRYYAGSNITEFKSDNEELEKVVNIAAKKAEFEQLTKDEKEIDKRVPYNTHYPISLRTDWKLLLFIILFCTVVGGGLFFIGMTLFSFLIEVIPQGFTAESISEFIKTFPLLYLAAMSFLGFGGLSGLILSVLLYVMGRFTRIR